MYTLIQIKRTTKKIARLNLLVLLLADLKIQRKKHNRLFKISKSFDVIVSQYSALISQCMYFTFVTLFIKGEEENENL